MVIVIAVLLSVAAISLGPYQQRNIRIEKMENILSSVNIESTSQDAEKTFAKFITEQLVLNTKGELVNGETAAFDIDLKKSWINQKQGTRIKNYFLYLFVIRTSRFFISSRLEEKVCGGPFGDTLLLKVI